jgi:hypothetical protein
MIRPYEFSSNPTAATGQYPSPYATATYDAAGMPIMDTRERKYFDQKYTALTPYSARVGTENPNKPIGAANGGLMAIGGPVEQMSRNVMGGQGNMFPQSQQEHTNFATPTQMPASAEVVRSDYDARTNPYTGVMMAKGGQVKGYFGGGIVVPDLKNISGMENYGSASEPYPYGYQGGGAAGLPGQTIQANQAPSQSAIDAMTASGEYNPQGNLPNNKDPIGSHVVSPSGESENPHIQNLHRMLDNNFNGQLAQQATSQSAYPSGPALQNNWGQAAQGYSGFSGGGGGGGGGGQPVELKGPVGIVQMANGGLSDIGYQGYGQPEGQAVRRPNPVGEYLVNQMLSKPAQPTATVVGGNTSSPSTQSSSEPSNQAETNPILRAMYEKQLQQPDYEFTQPELVSGWQAHNPNNFAYNRDVQKYSAATPSEQQLSAFKQQMADYMAQDRASKTAEQSSGAANGGLMPYNLGGYSDGGRLLRGPGDGVSDDIPATIAGKQPARLADGEFVIPARIVSEIGNGSTDAGAKRLYAMMDRIQAGRKKTIGKKNIAKDTKAKKHLLA